MSGGARPFADRPVAEESARLRESYTGYRPRGCGENGKSANGWGCATSKTNETGEGTTRCSCSAPTERIEQLDERHAVLCRRLHPAAKTKGSAIARRALSS